MPSNWQPLGSLHTEVQPNLRPFSGNQWLVFPLILSTGIQPSFPCNVPAQHASRIYHTTSPLKCTTKDANTAGCCSDSRCRIFLNANGSNPETDLGSIQTVEDSDWLATNSGILVQNSRRRISSIAQTTHNGINIGASPAHISPQGIPFSFCRNGAPSHQK